MSKVVYVNGHEGCEQAKDVYLQEPVVSSSNGVILASSCVFVAERSEEVVEMPMASERSSDERSDGVKTTNQAVFIALGALSELPFVLVEQFPAAVAIGARDEPHVAAALTHVPGRPCHQASQQSNELPCFVQLPDHFRAADVLPLDEDLRQRRILLAQHVLQLLLVRVVH
nr:hypothetical protein AXF42_Ash020403 [Ipomoea batatas]